MADAATPRKFRRLRRFLVILLISPPLLLAFLPTLLSTSPARLGLMALANRYIAPARLDVADLRLSWFGTTEVLGVSLRDGHGKRLVALSRATLEHSLVDLLLDQSSLGTLTIEEPALDITRRKDGSIDLIDLVASWRPARTSPARPDAPPAQASSPFAADFTLKVIQGKLRLGAPELVEPLKVDRYDLTVQSTTASGPLTVRLRMEKGAGARLSTLALDGSYDFRAPDPAAADLSLNMLAKRWPLHVRVASVTAQGTLEGQVSVIQKSGRWDLKGDTRVSGLEASGGPLAGDRLRLDPVTAIWDVVQGAGATPGAAAAPSPAPGVAAPLWDIRRLKLTTPVATLAATGPILGPPGTGATLDGRADLAALAHQLPHALRLREGLAVERGEAGLRISLKYEADAQTAELSAVLSDLIAQNDGRKITLHSPADLSARLSRRGSNVSVERLELTSGFMRTSGAGDLDQGIAINGALDLAALQAQLCDLIDFGGVALAGRGEYHLSYRRAGATFTGALTSEVHGLDLKGLTAEPIHREAVRLEAAVGGNAAPSGLPTSLDDLKLGLAAGQIGAFATATAQGPAAALSLVATGPLSLAEKCDGVARGDLKFQGTWIAPALDIDELRLVVHPANVPPEATAPALVVRGRFDPSQGTLDLGPIAGNPPAAVGLAAEGLHVSGLGPAGAAGGMKLIGNLAGDLGALDQLTAALTGGARQELAGSWTARLNSQSLPDGRLQWDVQLSTPDLSLPAAGAPGQPRSPEGPITLAAHGGYQAAGGLLAFEALRLITRYGELDGTGQIADATGRQLAELQGTLAPNWQTLNAMVAAAVDPAARLQGGAPRPFRIKGPLAAPSLAALLKGLDLELGINLAGAQALGLNLGPAPLVVLCDGGRTLMAPIVTTLNNGQLDVRPELVLDDPKGLVFRLLPGSTLQQIEIHDAVSHQLLSYIAPVLEEATQVRGHLSATVTRAEFPLGGAPDRTMNVAGALAFNNVVFAAGPLGGELLTVAGRNRDTMLRINQTLQIAVANRRVYQSGLVIPIGTDTRITVKGSVGFDETLALRAEVPVSPSLVARDRTLQNLVSGTTIAVPVGGTLTHPKVDRQALAAAVREVTRSILKRNPESEAAELLKRFVR